MKRSKEPILGQEAICPDGLGRVSAFNFTPIDKWIEVTTYINNRSCHWNADNVKLIKLQKEES